MNTKIRKISFHYQPYHYDQGGHAVVKSDGQGKRRYLQGISSGPKLDAHGERMTEKAIRSFMDQANSGDLLLYPDVHGIKSSEDIGIMTKAEILEDGDWFTEYRLYDNLDGVDDRSVQMADKIWKQINGLPPYTKPRQKGFSIEGFIPEVDGAIQHDIHGKSMINDVTLDGVVVVPRPAYTDSIATAIYKALGDTPPWSDPGTIVSRLNARMQETEDRDSFYRQKYQIEDSLDGLIREIMNDDSGTDKSARLSEIFDEYKGLMVSLILTHESAFAPDEISKDLSATEITVTKSNLLKGLVQNMESLELCMKEA